MRTHENWSLTVKVLSTRNIESEHGSFHLSWGGGGGGGAWQHRITEHAFVEGSDGNSYELVPDNPLDMLLPGTYQAKIEKRDMKVCEPKNNGNCRDVKFKIVTAVPTVKESGATPELVEPAPASPSAKITSSSVVVQTNVAVDSNPSGADIEIDGAFVGSTPSSVFVTSGSHQVSVKKKGFSSWTRTLNITGGSIHLNAELESVR